MDCSIEIRRDEVGDFDACYAISLATGFAGADASHLYLDPRLMGHIYIAPYALLEPTLTLIVKDSEGVAGFVAGTADTVAWEQRLEREWCVPPEMQTADQRRAFMIHHPAPTPAAVVASFPAYLHMNLLPRLQRRGIGSKLLDAWHHAASDRGVRATHVGVNPANEGTTRFWRARGFKTLAAEGGTLWMGCDGQ